MNVTRLPGIYIHIPFCESKCPYCDFYSVISSADRNTFLTSLLREVELRLNTLETPATFDTVYLGGGTPSLLSFQEIDRLFTFLNRYISLSLHPEITIEVNPESLTPEKVRYYRQSGINRLSIGVQSYRNEDLRYLGRIHSVSRAKEAFRMARETGFDNISIDLIHALPEQSLLQWQYSLDQALEDRPEHISAYDLIFEEGTPFHHRLLNKEIKNRDDDEALAFYTMTIDILENAGYLHYEISNYAISEHHISRHNYKYWNHADYLGFGPSAHSFWNKERWSNVRSVKDYESALRRNLLPLDFHEALREDEYRFEGVFLQLRTTRGIDLAEFENRYHVSFMDAYRDIVNDLILDNYARTDGKYFSLTKKGLYISDEILPFFAPL